MSDTPVQPPVAEVVATLADYEDISGEYQPAVPRTSSIAPEEPAEPPTRTPSPAPVQELETETEEDEEEQQPQPQPPPVEPVDVGSSLAAPMLVLGGIVLAGLAFFLNQPITIEHPLTRGDYF